ncbi:putative arogenate dehydrogenase (NADP(+)) [Helianthus debilis subsp. tardiflorus]
MKYKVSGFGDEGGVSALMKSEGSANGSAGEAFVAAAVGMASSYQHQLMVKYPQSTLHNPSTTIQNSPNKSPNSKTLKIAIVGFGDFGQFLTKTLVRQGHTVLAHSRSEYSAARAKLGHEIWLNQGGLMTGSGWIRVQTNSSMRQVIMITTMFVILLLCV